MIKKMILVALTLGFFATSCSDDDDNTPSIATLNLDLNGLEALGNDYVYEGWIIVDGAPISTGVFTSVTFPQSFIVDAAQLDAATKFVLSIEPVGETGAAALAPADTKVLAGDFSGDTANVNTGIVGDFSSAAGAFFLRTPTDETGMNNGNDQYGVWFGTPGAPPTSNFVLPTLPAGWAYEGWVVGENGPITTGTFNVFNMADDFDGFSETSQPGPPVPGEDFFLNAPSGETFPLDVRGRTVVISVEPVPDDSPAPFAMKPLVGTAGQETAPAVHAFGENLKSLPTGKVTR
ncbi:anti-sigma factor [uncultured Algibacter sp.]|uniref:anti-sigma factor n=1 Tax=uncultured Algibacter sp. TaxID=298659 RepID=UPI00262BB422|nr:anti-sigma factor [uncultured Algibacter sp.]